METRRTTVVFMLLVVSVSASGGDTVPHTTGQEQVSTQAAAPLVTPTQTTTGVTLTTTQTGDKCPETCSCTISEQLHLLVSDCVESSRQNLEKFLADHANVTKLAIVRSNMTTIPGAICSMDNLTSLNLTMNNLGQLGEAWSCLKNLPSLRNISLSHNQLSRIRRGDIGGFQKLERLSLSHNHISHIESEIYQDIKDLVTLKSLDLNDNRLTTIDTWPLASENLTVNLDRNEISNFTSEYPWACENSRLKYQINLRHNKIRRLNDMYQGWGLHSRHQRRCFTARSEHIRLDDNPILCDCVGYQLIPMMMELPYAFGNSIICKAPVRLYGRGVITIPLEEFYCTLSKDCPTSCNCRQIPATKTMLVNCTKRHINALPGNLPSIKRLQGYLYHLDFSSNKIGTIEDQPYFPQTKSAIFTRNGIQDVQFEALQSLENVTQLFLDHNQLIYLPDQIENVINMTEFLQLRIEDNSWICDCYAKESRRWLLQMGKRVVDRDGVLCASPADEHGRNMLLMDEDEFYCGPRRHTPWLEYVGVGAATVAAWLVVLGLPTVIIYTNRYRIYRKWKWHPFDKDECGGEYKEFDIYIAYAEVDSEYTMEVLFVDLENKGFDVAHHKVNFIGGKPIKVNIEECIRKSKRTITVLSKAYFNSDWCRVELLTAIDLDKKQRTKRHIAVLLEDVSDVPDLDPKVVKFLKTDRCLMLNSEQFEEKMAYLLGQKKVRDQRDVRPGYGGHPPKSVQNQRAKRTGRRVPAVDLSDPQARAAAFGHPMPPRAPDYLDNDGNPVFYTDDNDRQPLLAAGPSHE